MNDYFAEYRDSLSGYEDDYESHLQGPFQAGPYYTEYQLENADPYLIRVENDFLNDEVGELYPEVA